MKYAICNELFGSLDFERSMELLANHSYEGIEIAPYTVFFGNFSTSAVSKGLQTVRRGLAATGIQSCGSILVFRKARRNASGQLLIFFLRLGQGDHLRLLRDISARALGAAVY
jgi:hypothetical protein